MHHFLPYAKVYYEHWKRCQKETYLFYIKLYEPSTTHAMTLLATSSTSTLQPYHSYLPRQSLNVTCLPQQSCSVSQRTVNSHLFPYFFPYLLVHIVRTMYIYITNIAFSVSSYVHTTCILNPHISTALWVILYSPRAIHSFSSFFYKMLSLLIAEATDYHLKSYSLYHPMYPLLSREFNLFHIHT